MENDFSKRLKHALDCNSLSQTAFAQKISMSQSVVNEYCTGKKLPSLDVLIIICNELDVRADYLLGFTDKMYL